MADPDIVTRLRESDGGYFMRRMFTEAADEIERLRNERNAFEAERDQLISISNKLKRERDEARQEVCSEVAYRIDALEALVNPRSIAEQRNWDCFKEDANGR